MSLFPFTRAAAIRALVAGFQPDLIHLHGGIMTPFLARSPAFDVPVVTSVYGWAGPPSRREMARSTVAELRGCVGTQARVLLAGILPEAMVRAALDGRGPVRGVIAHDPRVAARLGGLARVPVRLAEWGASIDGRRAMLRGDAPVIVFAGRAETARGVDTLVRAMPGILRHHPAARLRLLLLPAPQLEGLRRMARRSPAAAAIEVVTDRPADLRVELARATVAAFPFKFDHTTSITPPLTVVEAMSVGLPVVVSAVGCMEAVVAARRGTVAVPPGDADAVARAVVAALDPPRWQRLSDEAYQLVRDRWNWDNAARVTGRLYEEVIDEARRTAARRRPPLRAAGRAL
ncbi:MAG TPA: glycosyltransferase [Acidimicrobiales bacterium]|nr:glycosyltransferase [Acidimicrobiales bacterium]